jgi:hypothetical protein
MRIIKDSLGRFDLVGDGHLEPASSSVGLIFDKALDIGSYSKPRPTKFTTTVYRQRQRRIGGTKFWDRETDFEEDSADAAEKKAKDYITGQKWQFVPYDGPS